MVIRGVPKDLDKYIKVTDSRINDGLQRMEYYPVYITNDGVYYDKTEELERLIESVTL